jgi:hypothetical protein
MEDRLLRARHGGLPTKTRKEIRAERATQKQIVGEREKAAVTGGKVRFPIGE